MQLLSVILEPDGAKDPKIKVAKIDLGLIAKIASLTWTSLNGVQ